MDRTICPRKPLPKKAPNKPIRRKESQKDPQKEFQVACKKKSYNLLSATWRPPIAQWEVLVAYNPPPPVFPGERKRYRLTASKWQGIVLLINDLPSPKPQDDGWNRAKYEVEDGEVFVREEY